MTSEKSEERVMTITHDEFLRCLKPLERHYEVDTSQFPELVLSKGESRAVITLSPPSVRSIANLRLPTTTVHITFTDFSATELKEFRRRFDLSFRKGGG